ncbi:MAG: hypothetical protein GX851_05340, partial [Clostridiales bacterium]|nr:hypothetical protein [Clostridiales bacterium]
MNYDFSFKRSVRGYHHIKTKLTENTRRFNMPYAEIYHGIGDRGGAPREQSVETVCREMRRNASAKSDVVSARADEIFLDLDALPRDIKSNLPVWKNELIATDHGTGCYTARSCGKRWNRRAEQLLSIAESFSLAASLAGEYDFRDSVINTAFKRVIAHQFHDDITGTGAMACSRRAWNDYAVSHAQLQNEIYASAGALSRILDTSFCTGIPLVVGSFSGVSGRRREVVRTEIECGNTENVCVYDAQENRIPCSFSRLTDTKHLLVFSADIPACGCAVFDVRPEAPRQVFKALSITKNSLENDYIKVLTDENGDICSIFDKQNSREALASPIRFLLTDFTGVANYPAWELEYGEVIKTPDAYPASPRVRIAEATPACAALEIKRSFKGSEFTQTVSLGRNSRRVDVCCEIDWRTPRSLLRVNFPFTVKSSEASYDLGLGVIKRKNSCKRLYEFPAQNWADITDEDGSYGVSVLSDSRTGWEKMTDNSLNLTAIFSPKASRGDSCSQQLLDFGLNRFSYSLLPHSGNAGAYTQREGAFFNSPVFAFETDRHEGKTREISFFNLKSENVAVRAFKKALNSDDIVVRFNELCGCGASVRFSLNDSLPGFKLISAHE